MRFTVQYHRHGHQVASRMHTNSYAAAEKHRLRVLCDADCSDVVFIDRDAES